MVIERLFSGLILLVDAKLLIDSHRKNMGNGNEHNRCNDDRARGGRDTEMKSALL